MTPSLEGLPTKAEEAPSPYEVRLALLETNPVFAPQVTNPVVAPQVAEQFKILLPMVIDDT